MLAYAKIATSIRTIFTLYAHQIFTAYARLAHTVLKNLGLIILHVQKLSRLVQNFASPWYFVIPVLRWVNFFADLPVYRSLNFCIRLLVSDSPGKFMHISIPICKNVYSYLITQIFFLIDRLYSCIEVVKLF